MTVRAYMKNPIIILLLMMAAVLSVGCGNSRIEGYYSRHHIDQEPLSNDIREFNIYHFKSDNMYELYEFRSKRSEYDNGFKRVGYWEVKNNELIATFKYEVGMTLNKFNLNKEIKER